MADQIIDAMAGPAVPVMSRWDRGDGAAAIAALDAALAAAGLSGRLAGPLGLLERAEERFGEARAAKLAAADRLERATRELLAGPVDLDVYEQTLLRCDLWLSADAPAMVAFMQAGHRLQQNATQTTFAMVTGLYQELAQVCAGVVAEVASVPALPREAWAAPRMEAASVAMRAGREREWSALVKAGDRWDAIHAAGRLLRETGTFQAELIFPNGCPAEVGVMFLGWRDAVERLPEVRRLPGPLRVRAAVDRGWRPGLWLRSDHQRAAVEPRKGLLARLVG